MMLLYIGRENVMPIGKSGGGEAHKFPLGASNKENIDEQSEVKKAAGCLTQVGSFSVDRPVTDGRDFIVLDSKEVKAEGDDEETFGAAWASARETEVVTSSRPPLSAVKTTGLGRGRVGFPGLNLKIQIGGFDRSKDPDPDELITPSPKKTASAAALPVFSSIDEKREYLTEGMKGHNIRGLDLSGVRGRREERDLGLRALDVAGKRDEEILQYVHTASKCGECALGTVGFPFSDIEFFKMFDAKNTFVGECIKQAISKMSGEGLFLHEPEKLFDFMVKNEMISPEIDLRGFVEEDGGLKKNVYLDITGLGTGTSGAKVVRLKRGRVRGKKEKSSKPLAILKASRSFDNLVMFKIRDKVKNKLLVEMQKKYPRLQIQDVEKKVNGRLEGAIREVIGDKKGGGVRVGIGFHEMPRREALAAVIGEDWGIVPNTKLVSLPGEGTSSLHQFVPDAHTIHYYSDEDKAEVLGNLDRQSFQNVALFNLLVGNTDCNRGNILFKKNGDVYESRSIDHGLILNPKFIVAGETEGLSMCWENWDEANKCLTEESIAKLKELDWSQMKDKIIGSLGKEAFTEDEMNVQCILMHMMKASGEMAEIKSFTTKGILLKMRGLGLQLDCLAKKGTFLESVQSLAQDKGETVERYCSSTLMDLMKEV
jgi:hypothetical protein